MIKSDIETNVKFSITKFFKSICICYGIALILLTVLAFFVTYLPISEEIVPFAVLIVTIISVALSGFLVARKAQSKGWLYGALTGIVYIVTLFLLGSVIFQKASFGIGFFTMLLVGTLSGAIGGIIGVNLRK